MIRVFEHEHTVKGSGEYHVMLSQGWRELLSYTSPRYNCERALMTREARS